MVCNPHYCLSEKNAISRSRVPPSRLFPSNCVGRPYINNRPPSPSRSVSMICCKSTYYITPERGEERRGLCILYSPPQMRVIMATIDERLSFSLLLFPLQKMTFHWVLVQKSNDLSLSLSPLSSPRKHLLTKAPSSKAPIRCLRLPLPLRNLFSTHLCKTVMGKM